MNQHESVVAVCDSFKEAERAVKKLENAGVGRDTLAIHKNKIVVTVRDDSARVSHSALKDKRK